MRFIAVLFSIFSIQVMGQVSTTGGFFPEMAISHSQKSWQYTLKIESQNYFYNAQSPEQWSAGRKQNDFQVFADYKVTPLISVSGGYQYRLLSDQDNTHRLIEQIGFVQKASRMRIGHRIRLDQMFLEEGIQWRFRYRFSTEIPLNGHSLDPTEYYLLGQAEAIASFEPGEKDLENRLYMAMGYVFKNAYKIQMGPDYRTDKYFIDGFRNRIWWKIGLFVKI